MIAISHESVAVNKKLSDQFGLEFPSLSDLDRSTIHNYDVVDGVFNIAKIVFFAIDKKGIIRWRSRSYSTSDANDLPPIDDLLDAIKLAQ